MILVVIQIAQYNMEFNTDLNQLTFSPFVQNNLLSSYLDSHLTNQQLKPYKKETYVKY